MGDFFKYFKVSVNDFYIYSLPGASFVCLATYFFPDTRILAVELLRGIGLNDLTTIQKMLVLLIGGSFFGVLITPVSSIGDEVLSKLVRRNQWPFLKTEQRLAKQFEKKIAKLYPGLDMKGQSLFEWLILILAEENSSETERLGIEFAKDAMIRNIAYSLLAVSVLGLILRTIDVKICIGFTFSILMILIFWYRQNVITNGSLIKVAIERERRTLFGRKTK